MPIAIRCSGCAEVLKVPDHMAGRQGKCPRCGEVLKIPAAAASAAALNAPTQMASSSARQTKATITNEQVPAAQRRTAAARDDEDDARDEADDRPRGGRKNKKRKKSSLLLFGLLGGGCFGLFLVCSGFGVFGWWYFFSGGIGDELKFMPSNCQMVFSIRAEQLMKSEVYKELEREMPDVNKEKANFSKEVGLSAEDVEQAVIGVGSNSKDVVIVVRTKKAVEARDLRSRIKNSKHTETKVGKYLMQESPNDSQPSFAVVDKKLVVFGDKEPVRAVLQRDKKPEFSKNLQMAMKQVDFSKTIAFAADVQSSRSKAGEAFGMFGPNKDVLRSLEKTNAVAVQVKVGSDVRLDLTLFCQDAASANDVKKLIDGFLVMGRNQQGIPKEVADLLELNLKTDGNKVIGNNTFKVGPLIKLAKQKNSRF